MPRSPLVAIPVVVCILLFGPMVRADNVPAPYEVNVVTSLTGPIAFVGVEEQATFNAMAQAVNEHGGIKGHPLKFVYQDDQSSVVGSVQLANGLIQKGVAVIVGPTLAANCAAVFPLIKNGPVLYCLSPAMHPKRGSYLFSSGVTIFDDAMALLRYAHDQGWGKIAIITSTDASGQEVDRSFAQAFASPENSSVHLIDLEHFNTTDLSVDAQSTHISFQHPDAVIAWTTGASFGTLLHGIHDAGITVPIVAASGNMTKAQLSQYRSFLPPNLYFPGLYGMTRATTAAPAIRAAQATYWAALGKAGLELSYTNNSLWDYVMVLVDALQHIGPTATADQIRDYIDNLHGWGGIQGMYTFSDAEQRGIGHDAIVVYRWASQDGRFDAISGAGGRSR